MPMGRQHFMEQTEQKIDVLKKQMQRSLVGRCVSYEEVGMLLQGNSTDSEQQTLAAGSGLEANPLCPADPKMGRATVNAPTVQFEFCGQLVKIL